MAVKKALGGLAGISGVEVDLGKGEVSMEHQGPIEMGVVRSEIEKAGYEVSS
jgi:copper chaperone CopZ